MKIKSNTIDIVALTSSLICAVHCAVIPLVLSFSSLANFYFLKNPYIELTFISFGIFFILYSLWPSYKKNHHNSKPLRYAAFGFTLIALGRLNLSELFEIIHTVTGASLLSFAHYLNWKLLRTINKH